MHGVLGVTIGAVVTCSEIIGKEYLINKNSESKAKLAYWHYGPSGHIIESKTVTGKILITKTLKYYFN